CRGEHHGDRTGDNPRRHRPRISAAAAAVRATGRGVTASGAAPVAELSHQVARPTGMAPVPAPDMELAALRAQAAHLRRVNQELLARVADLGATVEKQQPHIDSLVWMTSGRRSERVTEPTPTDDVPNPDSSPAADTLFTVNPPPQAATPRRRGHGRRPLP